MLNHYLADRPPVASWGAADGIVTYFGAGYQAFEHWGVGPTRKQLPAGAKLVILGSADLDVLSDDSYPWVRDHWLPYAPEAVRAAAHRPIDQMNTNARARHSHRNAAVNPRDTLDTRSGSQ
jgi:hypothetical protein